jgi:cellulose synthase/poly-beta-1,6-N-acetylglucosamine synthase-like glycosyltransferase
MVSVVIPAYNAARFLPEALASVLAEATPDVEVLVVDDGSTDDTQELLARYAPRVRSLRVANGGPGRARNAGLAGTRGPLVAFLDADDRWLEGSRARRRARLEADPGAALVHGPVRYVDAAGEPMAFDPLAYKAYRRQRRAGWVLRSLFWSNVIQTSTVLVRRAAVEAVGGFDERREVIEDYDLWLRLAARWPVAFVPEPVTVYRSRPESLGRRNLVRAYLGQIPPLEAALARGGLARTSLGRAWLRRRRLALLYADYADDLLRWTDDTAAAGAALAEALRLQPFAPRRAAVWGAIQAGPGALAAARTAVRRLRAARGSFRVRTP